MRRTGTEHRDTAGAYISLIMIPVHLESVRYMKRHRASRNHASSSSSRAVERRDAGEPTHRDGNWRDGEGGGLDAGEPTHRLRLGDMTTLSRSSGPSPIRCGCRHILTTVKARLRLRRCLLRIPRPSSLSRTAAADVRSACRILCRTALRPWSASATYGARIRCHDKVL